MDVNKTIFVLKTTNSNCDHRDQSKSHPRLGCIYYLNRREEKLKVGERVRNKEEISGSTPNTSTIKISDFLIFYLYSELRQLELCMY